MNEVAEQAVNQDDMIKFRVIWREHVRTYNGEGEEAENYHEDKSAYIFAKNEDHAIDIWEEKYANEGTNGCDSCEPCIEDPLLHGSFSFELQNGDIYSIRAEELLKRHACSVMSNDPNAMNELEALVQVSLPLLRNNPEEIHKYLKTLPWSWIERNSSITRKLPNKTELENYFRDYAAVGFGGPKFNRAILKDSNASTVAYLISQALDAMELSEDEQAIKQDAIELCQYTLSVGFEVQAIGYVDVDAKFNVMDWLCDFAFNNYYHSTQKEQPAIEYEQGRLRSYLEQKFQITSDKEYHDKSDEQIDPMIKLLQKAANHLTEQQA